jgi:hypothetical protein
MVFGTMGANGVQRFHAVTPLTIPYLEWFCMGDGVVMTMIASRRDENQALGVVVGVCGCREAVNTHQWGIGIIGSWRIR